MTFLIILIGLWLLLLTWIVYIKHKQNTELWYDHYKDFHNENLKNDWPREVK